MRHHSTRLIALIAAYAIALQALLPLVAAADPASGWTICSSAATDGSPQAPDVPDRHEASGWCAVGCAVAGGPMLLPPAGAAVLPVASNGAAVTVVYASSLALPKLRGPQAPRGPPAA